MLWYGFYFIFSNAYNYAIYCKLFALFFSSLLLEANRCKIHVSFRRRKKVQWCCRWCCSHHTFPFVIWRFHLKDFVCIHSKFKNNNKKREKIGKANIILYFKHIRFTFIYFGASIDFYFGMIFIIFIKEILHEHFH